MAAEEPDNHDVQEKTQQALQAAYESLPPEYPWGYFHYLDGPPAAGGGTGCFAWFESRDALLTFIARYQAWIGAPDDTDVPVRKAEKVLSVISRLHADEIDMEQARLQINELLQGFSQIEWWGRADELLTGDSDFTCELREWYRDFSRKGSADPSPIAAAEVQEFFYALQGGGM